MMFFSLCLLLAGCARSAGIVFTRMRIFRFFAPQGHVAPIKVKFGRENPPCQISP